MHSPPPRGRGVDELLNEAFLEQILETEGVEDEEQACKIEELSELIDKEAGEAGDEMEEDD